jgi:geranylgeranyl reductase family protein
VADSSEWDVIVVGGGPAGLSAARAAALQGARTLVLERAVHPRYKTCGGGLVGASLAALPVDLELPVRSSVNSVTFSFRGRWSYTKVSSKDPLLVMVNRDEFDLALYKSAQASGVTVEQRTTVRNIEAQSDDRLAVTAKDGRVFIGQIVIGADGSSGVTAKYAGVQYEQVDLGLEYEVPLPADRVGDWTGRALLDWGPLPGSYAWIFPKGEQLTVGVIAERGRGQETREYLAAFLEQHGLQDIEPLNNSGHLTRCRTTDSPLRNGRLLVAGDAAGLLEPWTREGISYALRSGALAGTTAGAAIRDKDYDNLDGYEAEVASTLGREIAAGRQLFAAFSRWPIFVHLALRMPRGWQTFIRICRGDYSFARAMSHRSARIAVKVLTMRPG